MKFPKTRDIVTVFWCIISTTVIVVLGVAILLFGQLETLLPGYSKNEVLTAKSASSLKVIVDNPINAPYKLGVYVISHVVKDPLLSTRLTSATFGTLTLVMFYYFIRKIHTARIAFLATTMLACSAWFLHTARMGTPDIMLPFAAMLFITCGNLLMQYKNKGTISVVAIFTLGLCLYVPGMAWFLAIALIVRNRKDIRTIISDQQLLKLVALLAALILFVIVPIVWTISKNPKFLLDMLGIPTNFVHNISSLPHDIIAVPISLFAYSHINPAVWLGQLPLLDIASSALFILGLYYYFSFRKLDRAKLLLMYIVTAIILIAIGGGVTSAILIPAIYICIAGGVTLLIAQWFIVFPSNPLAKSVGVFLMAAVIISSVTYNIQAYYVAWPNWPPTKSIYTFTNT